MSHRHEASIWESELVEWLQRQLNLDRQQINFLTDDLRRYELASKNYEHRSYGSAEWKWRLLRAGLDLARAAVSVERYSAIDFGKTGDDLTSDS